MSAIITINCLRCRDTGIYPVNAEDDFDVQYCGCRAGKNLEFSEDEEVNDICRVCEGMGEVSDYNGDHFSEWSTKPCVCTI